MWSRSFGPAVTTGTDVYIRVGFLFWIEFLQIKRQHVWLPVLWALWRRQKSSCLLCHCCHCLDSPRSVASLGCISVILLSKQVNVAVQLQHSWQHWDVGQGKVRLLSQHWWLSIPLLYGLFIYGLKSFPLLETHNWLLDMGDWIPQERCYFCACSCFRRGTCKYNFLSFFFFFSVFKRNLDRLG